MAQPYVGEIRIFAGNFAPAGWHFCDGALMPISENETLFTVIGTTYGGDGESTFALPDLQSRIPIHMGTGPDGTSYVIGENGGVEQVTLTGQQTPVHNHAYLASTAFGSIRNPSGAVAAQSSTIIAYIQESPDSTVQFSPQAVGPAGGSQPHTNLQPLLVLNFIISLFGLFPSPT
jgi:microcystin-dependent protein